jgi:hypothetical protein
VKPGDADRRFCIFVGSGVIGASFTGEEPRSRVSAAAGRAAEPTAGIMDGGGSSLLSNLVFVKEY